MSIDLHVHTNFSDGTDSPEEIVKKAEIIGLNTIAITDHETIDGLSSIKESKINIICGVEVSAKWEKLKINNNESGIHVLFYFVNPKTGLYDLLKEIRDEKRLRNLEIINKLKNLDIEIDITKECIYSINHNIRIPPIRGIIISLFFNWNTSYIAPVFFFNKCPLAFFNRKGFERFKNYQY